MARTVYLLARSLCIFIFGSFIFFVISNSLRFFFLLLLLFFCWLVCEWVCVFSPVADVKKRWTLCQNNRKKKRNQKIRKKKWISQTQNEEKDEAKRQNEKERDREGKISLSHEYTQFQCDSPFLYRFPFVKCSRSLWLTRKFISRLFWCVLSPPFGLTMKSNWVRAEVATRFSSFLEILWRWSPPYVDGVDRCRRRRRPHSQSRWSRRL